MHLVGDGEHGTLGSHGARPEQITAAVLAPSKPGPSHCAAAEGQHHRCRQVGDGEGRRRHQTLDKGGRVALMPPRRTGGARGCRRLGRWGRHRRGSSVRGRDLHRSQPWRAGKGGAVCCLDAVDVACRAAVKGLAPPPRGKAVQRSDRRSRPPGAAVSAPVHARRRSGSRRRRWGGEQAVSGWGETGESRRGGPPGCLARWPCPGWGKEATHVEGQVGDSNRFEMHRRVCMAGRVGLDPCGGWVGWIGARLRGLARWGLGTQLVSLVGAVGWGFP